MSARNFGNSSPSDPRLGLDVEAWPPTALRDMRERLRFLEARSLCVEKKVGCVLLTGTLDVEGSNGTYLSGSPCKAPQNKCVHAEDRALRAAKGAGVSVHGALVFASFSPCAKCAALLIAARIGTLVFTRLHRDVAGIRALVAAGIRVYQLVNERVVRVPNLEDLDDHFATVDVGADLPPSFDGLLSEQKRLVEDMAFVRVHLNNLEAAIIERDQILAGQCQEDEDRKRKPTLYAQGSAKAREMEGLGRERSLIEVLTRIDLEDHILREAESGRIFRKRP